MINRCGPQLVEILTVNGRQFRFSKKEMVAMSSNTRQVYRFSDNLKVLVNFCFKTSSFLLIRNGDGELEF